MRVNKHKNKQRSKYNDIYNYKHAPGVFMFEEAEYQVKKQY